MDRVFLLFGSNQGDQARNLNTAKSKVELTAGKIVSASSVYKTEAWGKTNQPDFYNQVVELSTTHSPEVLLDKLLLIEQGMGRERKEKWGARLIDIDILFFGNQIHQSASLTLPHPLIPTRRFTLIPLVEIAPDLLHPVLHQSMQELLEACLDPLLVEKL